jgi:hypothetical protein
MGDDCDLVFVCNSITGGQMRRLRQPSALELLRSDIVFVLEHKQARGNCGASRSVV